jgi:hypothetical protein
MHRHDLENRIPGVETPYDKEVQHPQPHPCSSKSLVLHDGPSTTTLLFHSNGGNAYDAVSRWDFRGVRTRLTRRYGVLHCEYVVASRRDRDRRTLAQYLQSSGWKLIEAAARLSINRDATDAYIVTRIMAAQSMLRVGPFTRIVLITHDGGFAQPLASFADAGGSATICAFLGVASSRLRALGAHPRIELLDLNRDLAALPY